MSIGIGGKFLGKGFELFLGKKKYSKSIRIGGFDLLDFKEYNFSLLSLEIALRW